MKTVMVMPGLNRGSEKKPSRLRKKARHRVFYFWGKGFSGYVWGLLGIMACTAANRSDLHIPPVSHRFMLLKQCH